jgi:hypothetical protein
MEAVPYSLQALLQAPAVDGDPARLRYLVERLPLYVGRVEAAMQAGDRSKLRMLSHDGKGLYFDLGRIGDIFTQMYAVALSANVGELNDMVAALREDASRIRAVVA